MLPRPPMFLENRMLKTELFNVHIKAGHMSRFFQSGRAVLIMCVLFPEEIMNQWVFNSKKYF